MPLEPINRLNSGAEQQQAYSTALEVALLRHEISSRADRTERLLWALIIATLVGSGGGIIAQAAAPGAQAAPQIIIPAPAQAAAPIQTSGK